MTGDNETLERIRSSDDHTLYDTDHDRVHWLSESPDHRGLEAATTIADEFEDMEVIGSHSRMAMSDVEFHVLGENEPEVIALKFYPIRANHHTHKVIEDIREYLNEGEGE